MRSAFATATDLERDAAFWRLYDASFPPSTREPRSVILRMVESGAGFVLRVRRDDETVGFSVVHLLRSPAAAFLVYLAVRSECRGEGLGRALVADSAAAGAARLRASGLSPRGLILETGDAGPFFGYLGGHVLPVAYRQPALDRGAPVPLTLMFLPHQGEPMPDAETSAALVRAIYFEKYHRMNGISREELEALGAPHPPV